MNGYPFLENKGEYPFSTAAGEVMHTGKHGVGLRVIYNALHTVSEIEALLRESTFSGFPVVVSPESRLIVGFCTRRDLESALRSVRRSSQYVSASSRVYFVATDDTPAGVSGGGGGGDGGGGAPTQAAVRLRKAIDLAPMTVTGEWAHFIVSAKHFANHKLAAFLFTDETPMETVIDM